MAAPRVRGLLPCRGAGPRRVLAVARPDRRAARQFCPRRRAVSAAERAPGQDHRPLWGPGDPRDTEDRSGTDPPRCRSVGPPERCRSGGRTAAGATAGRRTPCATGARALGALRLRRPRKTSEAPREASTSRAPALPTTASSVASMPEGQCCHGRSTSADSCEVLLLQPWTTRNPVSRLTAAPNAKARTWSSGAHRSGPGTTSWCDIARQPAAPALGGGTGSSANGTWEWGCRSPACATRRGSPYIPGFTSGPVRRRRAFVRSVQTDGAGTGA